MKLFLPSIFSGCLLLTITATSLTPAQAQTFQSEFLSQQSLLESPQIIWTKSDGDAHHSPSTHASTSHPILHVIASLLGLNHSRSSSATQNSTSKFHYSPQTYSSFSSSETTHSSFDSRTPFRSSTGGFIHSLTSAISNGFKAITSIPTIINKVEEVIKISAPTAEKWVKRAFYLNSTGQSSIPAPLVPSQQVLENAAGKIPVILVHGGFSNGNDMKLYYNAFEKAGIPVYAPTIGTGPSGLIPFISPNLGETSHVAQSTQELSQFIDQVQKTTGSPKVDLVGVSQAGLVMQNYLVHDHKNNVEAVASMGGAIHGTSYRGLVEILQSLPKPISHIIKQAINAIEGPANTDLLNDSPLVKELNKYPDTKPGINYLDIASNTDDVITPWNTASYRTAVPEAHVINREVHTIPGVPDDFVHGQYGKVQSIVDTAVQFIQDQGETGLGIPAKKIPALINTPQKSQIINPPTVSLLG